MFFPQFLQVNAHKDTTAVICTIHPPHNS
jgi:hypothetical protein